MDKPKLELKNKYFNLKFDNRGITSLKKDCDKFDTDYIRDKMNLGNVKIAYRKNKGPWIATSTNQAAPKAACQITSSSCKNTFVINDDLKVLVSYKLNGKKLSWDIKFSNLTNDDIQIGDIGLPFPCNTIYTWDKETTLNHRVLRHSHVAGHGSFMFWLRCNTLGPYLLLQPKKNTKLEYFDLIGKDQNNQDYTAFINFVK